MKLLEHFKAMQGMASRYLEPGPYTTMIPGATPTTHDDGDKQARNDLFINDMIYMLDGPEQREAQAERTFTIPELLRIMHTGWVLLEASYEQRTETTMEATRSPEDAMAEAAGGDILLGELLVLFGHWSNDINSLAAHYGVGLARKQPDGSLVYPDGTIGTLLEGGELTVTEVPTAPSPEYYWHAGKWIAPCEPDMSGEELG